MNNLKTESLNKCLSLLREYLDEGPLNEKKGGAILALNHLQKITAGEGPEDTGYSLISCDGKPRANG